MLALLLMAAAYAVQPGVASPAPACRASQLRLSLDGKDGDFNGMSHSGVELSIRNDGAACTMPGLPVVELRDARGRLLPAARKAPVGMHPGPVVLPVRIARGGRVATDLRWVSGPVFTTNRSVRVATVTVRIGGSTLRAPLAAVLYGEGGKPVGFEQPPLRSVR